MIRAPWFWRDETLAARGAAFGLTPLAALYDLAQRARWKMTRPALAPVPVICIGNATLGGAGKTPFAIALMKLLRAENIAGHFLTRGYGGSARGPIRVDLSMHDVAKVGDEALLLARHAPVWVARNRPAGAAMAAKAGADIIIMDDGFQNPAIEKTISILLIDARDPAGNGKVFPAGPLREPLARAKARADLIVHVGREEISAGDGADFAAWLEPEGAPPPQRVAAFSGIGNPDKFFDTLSRAKFDVASVLAFPDHYQFTDHDLSALVKQAAAAEAALITTEKDHVRLPAAYKEQVMVFPVAMKIDQPARLTRAVLSAIGHRNAAAKDGLE